MAGPMTVFAQLFAWLDALLIAPYRWVDDPMPAWWLGTLVLALWCALAGELTRRLVVRVNRAHAQRLDQEMRRYRDAAQAAADAGDKPAYKLLNKQANEAFGRTFFLRAAMGSASLWPAFLAVAWLQARFDGLSISLFGLGLGVNYLAGFLICYLLARLFLTRLKKIIHYFTLYNKAKI